MADRLPFDLSTLDMEALAKLPTYTLPPTYRLQVDPGNGCSGDPPGYPSYFTRSIYTAHGNSPPHGRPQMLLMGHVVPDDLERSAALFRRLYKPLPIDHPRVRAWIDGLLRHFRSCYRDAERPEYGRPGTLIYPLPDYKLQRTPVDEARWTEEAKQAARDLDAKVNAAEEARARALAVPDNHLAVLAVREVYPDWTPPANLEPSSPDHEGDWWERHAERPTPESCRPPSWYNFGQHRPEWCQFCGHKTPLPTPEAA